MLDRDFIVAQCDHISVAIKELEGILGKKYNEKQMILSRTYLENATKYGSDDEFMQKLLDTFPTESNLICAAKMAHFDDELKVNVYNIVFNKIKKKYLEAEK